MEIDNTVEENLENSNESNYIITNEQNSIDGEKVLNIAKQVADVLSKIFAYIGVLAILSYPVIHIINKFCNIDKFMASIPLGYTTSVADWENMPHSANCVMIFFGFLCLFFGLKMCLWLMKLHSVAARITCIIIGILFIICMVSKAANDILLTGVNCIAILAFIIFVGIPVLAFALKCTPFGAFVPKGFVSSYYSTLLRIFPRN